MQVNQKLRSALLVAGLLLTGASVFWANRLPQDDAAVVAPAGGHAARPRAAGAASEAGRDVSATAGGLDLKRLQRSRSQDPNASLFQTGSFAPEPPKPVARAGRAGSRELPAAPPPPPPPPPLPFTYMGQLVEGNQTLVFLAQGDRNISVRKGEVIDDQYRVEDINQSELVLVYLPQNIKQTLPIGVPK